MGSAPSEPLRRKNFRTSHIVVFQPNIMELRCQSEYVCVCCEYSGRHACFCVLDVNESSALFLCITTCDVILRTSAHNPTGGAAVGSSQIRLRFSGSASVGQGAAGRPALWRCGAKLGRRTQEAFHTPPEHRHVQSTDNREQCLSRARSWN